MDECEPHPPAGRSVDRKPVLLLEIREERVLVDEAELDEVARERAAVLALLVDRPTQMVGRDLTATDQQIAEA